MTPGQHPTHSLQVDSKAQFRVLLYYKFVTIEDPAKLQQQQLELCKSLGLLGRIIVAEEGLNGTVSGPLESTQSYMDWARADERFADMPFKIDEADSHVFPRLSVKLRKEVVTMGIALKEPVSQTTGTHLSPEEFHEYLNDPRTIVLDGRSDYEFDLGRFKGAIRPDAEVFKEFPDWLRAQSYDKNQPILTYCTGGIRCEKLTAFMIEEGFKNVYQLNGGIINYGKDPNVRGADFEGKCYVFDQRLAVPINHANPSVVGSCRFCGAPTEEYVNCANVECNLLFLCCTECELSHQRCCSSKCQGASRFRPKGGKFPAAMA